MLNSQPKKFVLKEKLKLNQQQQPVANLFQIVRNPLRKNEGIFYLRCLVILFFLFPALSITAQAKLEIKESKKNFGFVKRGTVVKNEYEISNTGNAPLIITDVEIACSCTSVDFPKQPVLPGQSAKVLVTFNTQTVYGRQDRVVYLNSNDPKGPHKLRYKGSVSTK